MITSSISSFPPSCFNIFTQVRDPVSCRVLTRVEAGRRSGFSNSDTPDRTAVGFAPRVLPIWIVGPLLKMDMYAVAQSHIRQILLSRGPLLPDAKPNFESGPHRIAYRYFAQQG